MYTETMLRRPLSASGRSRDARHVALPADIDAHRRRRSRRWALSRGRSATVDRLDARVPLGAPWQLAALRTLYGA